MKVKIRKGDMVEVIAGNDIGKRGEVLRVIQRKDGGHRVVVQGIAMRKRHQKKQRTGGRQNLAPGIVSFEGSIDISNVLLIDPQKDQPTRVGLKRDPQTGKAARVARKSGELIDR